MCLNRSFFSISFEFMKKYTGKGLIFSKKRCKIPEKEEKKLIRLKSP